jgi:hypothetical protein
MSFVCMCSVFVIPKTAMVLANEQSQSINKSINATNEQTKQVLLFFFLDLSNYKL